MMSHESGIPSKRQKSSLAAGKASETHRTNYSAKKRPLQFSAREQYSLPGRLQGKQLFSVECI